MKPFPARLGLTCLAASLCCVPSVVCAQKIAEEVSAGYVLPETESWDITAGNGQEYRIYVSRPEGEPPDEGYPVLYVLDGNAMFAGFAEARRVQGVYDGDREKMIVVGIGYPNRDLYDPRRMYDFTPPIQTPQLAELYKAYRQGGRDLFLTFLLEELKPEIARRYSVNPLRQSLFGHSLGGLFALHVLYARPGAFHTIVAASPSIWWDNQMILDEERAFAARIAEHPALARASRVSVMVGSDEETGVTVGDAIALGKRLQSLSAYGLRSQFELFEGEGHLTVPSRAVTPTLRAALQWP